MKGKKEKEKERREGRKRGEGGEGEEGKKGERKKKWNWSFFSLSAGKLTARCSGNFKLLPRLPVRVGWTLELEDIHGESFGE